MNFIDHINDFLLKWRGAITLFIFISTYLWVAVGQGKTIRLDRTGFALFGAFSMITFGCLTFDQAVGCINFHTLALVFALMLVSSQLHYAGFYVAIGNYLMRFLDRPKLALFVVMVGTAVASSFINNTIIALAFAPLLASITIRRGINPTPFLIGLCMTNNGCMTIIGNPQNVLVGQLGHVDFLGYAAYAFVPVFLSAVVCFLVCWLLGRNHMMLKSCPIDQTAENTQDTPEFQLKGTLKGLLTLLVIILLFIFTDWDRGMISLSAAGFLLCSHALSSREILSRIDWQTILLFMGLFVVVGAFDLNGLGTQFINTLTTAGVDLSEPVTMALSSAVLSNMINNTAAVMLLGQIVDLSEHWKTAYALAMSNALAGNFILLGSLSNMVIIKALEKAGRKITIKMFLYYSLPCTGASLLILIAWLYWV